MSSLNRQRHTLLPVAEAIINQHLVKIGRSLLSDPRIKVVPRCQHSTEVMVYIWGKTSNLGFDARLRFLQNGTFQVGHLEVGTSRTTLHPEEQLTAA